MRSTGTSPVVASELVTDMELDRIAREIRKDVVRMHRVGSNVGSAMSVVDILTVLYFDHMHVPSPGDPARDRFILSKGHAAAAFYATLAQKGFIERSLLSQWLADGSPLAGHPCAGLVPGVEVSTGSLGHGLAIAAGMALAARHDGHTHRFYVLMGDGELQEGTVWEAAIQAARLGLDSITAVIDANDVQGYDRVSEIQPVETLAGRFEAFGWATAEIDGHDLSQLSETLARTPFEPGKPSVLVARTVLGKGVSEMEDKLGWHYFNVPEEKLDEFIEEIDGDGKP